MSLRTGYPMNFLVPPVGIRRTGGEDAGAV